MDEMQPIKNHCDFHFARVKLRLFGRFCPQFDCLLGNPVP